MTDQAPPSFEATVKAALVASAQTIFGKNVVFVLFTVFVAASATLDAVGVTTNVWSLIKSAFSEKTSVLNVSEIEVLDEWVILIDSAESFSQADAYREQLASHVLTHFSSGLAAEHFARNLRVVRHPTSLGHWLLTADVVSSRSSAVEVSATIECIKNQVNNWQKDDILSPWFRAAKPYDYSLESFMNTYGRATNVPENHCKKSESSEKTCPSPYNEPVVQPLPVK